MDIDVRSVTSSDRTTIEQLYENYLHELHPERSQLPIEPNEWISNIYSVRSPLLPNLGAGLFQESVDVCLLISC
jgi:hypothetical protein